MLSVYCTALFKEHFEPPDSLSMSKKNLGRIANINIIILNLVKKLFYTTVLSYV